MADKKSLELVAQMKQEAQSKVDGFDALSQQIATDIKDSSAEAVAEYKAQAGEPDDAKLYTEEYLQAQVLKAQEQAKAEAEAAAKTELEAAAKAQADAEAKVSESETKIADLEKQLSEQGDQVKIDAALVEERKAMVSKYQGFVSGIRNAKVDDAKVADDMEAAAKELQDKIDAVPAEEPAEGEEQK